LLSYFNQLIGGGAGRGAAIMQACQTRFRPVMMTCIAACVGLLPAALSTAIGAQVQRPLALVVVGGILLTPILVLIILPVLIDVFSRRTRPEVVIKGLRNPLSKASTSVLGLVMRLCPSAVQRLANDRFWHKAALPKGQSVCPLLGQSGHGGASGFDILWSRLA
jgi:hypothetical protein